MSLRDRFRAAGRALFTNQFDGASDNPQRSSTVYFPLNSRVEITPYQRREMIKKHRSLRNNLGVVRGIIDTTVRLSIGWGLQPIPKSPDKDFNTRALAYWKRNTKSQNFDVSGQDKEPSMQRLVLRETITDGEIFGIKVMDDFGKAQRQIIKTEQIGDPPGSTRDDNWQDGILTNSLGRPLRYSILQDRNPSQLESKRATLIDPQEILHVYNRERAHQRHGLPWGYTGLNHGIDALDIASFEKITHKLNTAIIGSISSPDGQVPASMRGLLPEVTAAAAATTEGGTRSLDIYGSKIMVHKTTEAMNLFLQGRNSVNTIEFTAWLAAQYAQGFGCPIETVIGMMQGGAAVRGNTEIGGRFFEEVQMLMIDDWCQPNWENIIGQGLLAAAYPKDYPGVEPLPPPQGKTWEGWDAVEWRGPKNITHDRKNDGKMYLEQKRAGWITDEEWWTMNNEDPVEMSETIDRETKERLDRWLAHGLPEDKFWLRELGQVAQNANPKPDAAPTPV